MLPKERNTKWIVAVGLSLLVLIAAFSQTSWLDSFENLLLDWRFMLRGQKPFPDKIMVVGIDESSLDALGQWPWPREKHSKFLFFVNQPFFRPAVTAYDILFEHSDMKYAESDAAFAQQASALGKNFISAYFFEKGFVSSVETNLEKDKILERFALPESKEYPEKLETMDKVSLPYDELLNAGSLGFANNPADRDGRTRRVELLVHRQGRIYPSFALLSAARFMGAELNDIEIQKRAVIIKKSRFGKRVIPITANGDMLINYWGSFRQMPRLSFLTLLEEGGAWMDQNEKPIKLKSLKDKLVIVGATALGLADRCVTPFHENDPAVSVQAQAIANITEGVFLKQIPEFISLLVLILLGFIVVMFTAMQRALRAFSFIFIVVVLYLEIVYTAFLNNYWMDVAWPLVTIAVLSVAIVCLRYFLTAQELKKTYADLVRAEKMASLGTLSASIAHEYRNFMAAISMAADSCMMPEIKRENLNHCLEIIQRTVKKAGQVSEGLLTFARKNDSVKTQGRLEKTVEDVLLILEDSLKTDNVQIKKEFAEIDPIYYDEGQIAQVLMNMLRNGRDALKNKKGEKQIVLRLQNAGNRVLIEIEDNGSGIPKQILNRLFEPFATSKKPGEGTGLGLSVCHGIILNHDGEIKVKTQEGIGTTWQIFLPKK